MESQNSNAPRVIDFDRFVCVEFGRSVEMVEETVWSNRLE